MFPEFIPIHGPVPGLRTPIASRRVHVIVPQWEGGTATYSAEQSDADVEFAGQGSNIEDALVVDVRQGHMKARPLGFAATAHQYRFDAGEGFIPRTKRRQHFPRSPQSNALC